MYEVQVCLAPARRESLSKGGDAMQTLLLLPMRLRRLGAILFLLVGLFCGGTLTGTITGCLDEEIDAPEPDTTQTGGECPPGPPI
jgi:hypothetical protein